MVKATLRKGKTKNIHTRKFKHKSSGITTRNFERKNAETETDAPKKSYTTQKKNLTTKVGRKTVLDRVSPRGKGKGARKGEGKGARKGGKEADRLQKRKRRFEEDKALPPLPKKPRRQLATSKGAPPQNKLKSKQSPAKSAPRPQNRQRYYLTGRQVRTSPAKPTRAPVRAPAKPVPAAAHKAEGKEFKTKVTKAAEESSSSSEDSSSEEEEESQPGFGPKLHVRAKEDGALILIRNLPKDVTQTDILLELFPGFPSIEQVSLAFDDDGNPTGTAQVVLANRKEAQSLLTKFRDVEYRNHRIYLTLMGTSTVKATAKPLVKAKKKKKKKKKGKEEEIASPAVESTMAVASESSPQKAEPVVSAMKCKIQTPSCVVPETRPWNWGTESSGDGEYPFDYIPANWEVNDEIFYHVTMKADLRQHLNES